MKESIYFYSKTVRFKFISFIVLIFFSIVNIFGNTPSANAQMAVKAAFEPCRLNIPLEAGRIRSLFNSENVDMPLVIHIQDAHLNYGAQKNIIKILSYLQDKYNLDTAFVEGVSKEVDVSLLKSFPLKEEKEKIIDDCLKEGKISGVEAYSILSGKKFRLIGVDREEDYIKNVKLYVKVARLGDKVIPVIEDIRDRLDKLALSSLNSELLEFIEKKKEFNKPESNPLEYIRYLAHITRRLNIPLSKSGGFGKLVEMNIYQEHIDLKELEVERRKLVEERLLPVITDGEETNLISLELDRISKKAGEFEYFSFLKNLSKKYGIDFKSYENLNRYYYYLLLSKSITPDSIMSGRKRVERLVERSLVKTSKEKDILSLVKDMEVALNMVRLHGIKDDIKYYRKRKKEYGKSELNNRLREMGIEVDLTNYPSNGLELFDRFYEVAESRENTFVLKAIKKAKRSGKRVVVLFTGGYHTDGIERLLRNKGMSYAVIAPRVEDISSVGIYDKVMRDYEKYFGVREGKRGGTVAKVTPLMPNSNSAIYKEEYKKFIEAMLLKLNEAVDDFADKFKAGIYQIDDLLDMFDESKRDEAEVLIKKYEFNAKQADKHNEIKKLIAELWNLTVRGNAVVYDDATGEIKVVSFDYALSYPIMELNKAVLDKNAVGRITEEIKDINGVSRAKKIDVRLDNNEGKTVEVKVVNKKDLRNDSAIHIKKKDIKNKDIKNKDENKKPAISYNDIRNSADYSIYITLSFLLFAMVAFSIILEVAGVNDIRNLKDVSFGLYYFANILVGGLILFTLSCGTIILISFVLPNYSLDNRILNYEIAERGDSILKPVNLLIKDIPFIVKYVVYFHELLHFVPGLKNEDKEAHFIINSLTAVFAFPIFIISSIYTAVKALFSGVENITKKVRMHKIETLMSDNTSVAHNKLFLMMLTEIDDEVYSFIKKWFEKERIRVDYSSFSNRYKGKLNKVEVFGSDKEKKRLAECEKFLDNYEPENVNSDTPNMMIGDISDRKEDKILDILVMNVEKIMDYSYHIIKIFCGLFIAIDVMLMLIGLTFNMKYIIDFKDMPLGLYYFLIFSFSGNIFFFLNYVVLTFVVYKMARKWDNFLNSDEFFTAEISDIEKSIAYFHELLHFVPGLKNEDKEAHFIINSLTAVFAFPIFIISSIYTAVKALFSGVFYSIVVLPFKGVENITKKVRMHKIETLMSDNTSVAHNKLFLMMLTEIDDEVYLSIKNWFEKERIRVDYSSFSNRYKVKLNKVEVFGSDKEKKRLAECEKFLDNYEPENINSDTPNMMIGDISESGLYAFYGGVVYALLFLGNLLSKYAGEVFTVGSFILALNFLVSFLFLRIFYDVIGGAPTDSVAERGNLVKFNTYVPFMYKGIVYLHELLHFVPGLRGNGKKTHVVINFLTAVFTPLIVVSTPFYFATLKFVNFLWNRVKKVAKGYITGFIRISMKKAVERDTESGSTLFLWSVLYPEIIDGSLFDEIKDIFENNDLRIYCSDFRKDELKALYEAVNSGGNDERRRFNELKKYLVDYDKNFKRLNKKNDNPRMRFSDILLSLFIGVVGSTVSLITAFQYNSRVAVFFVAYFIASIMFIGGGVFLKVLVDSTLMGNKVIAFRGDSIKKPVMFSDDIFFDGVASVPIVLHEIFHFMPGLKRENGIQHFIIATAVAVFTPVGVGVYGFNRILSFVLNLAPYIGIDMPSVAMRFWSVKKLIERKSYNKLAERLLSEKNPVIRDMITTALDAVEYKLNLSDVDNSVDKLFVDNIIMEIMKSKYIDDNRAKMAKDVLKYIKDPEIEDWYKTYKSKKAAMRIKDFGMSAWFSLFGFFVAGIFYAVSFGGAVATGAGGFYKGFFDSVLWLFIGNMISLIALYNTYDGVKNIIAERGDNILKPVRFKKNVPVILNGVVYLHELLHFLPGLENDGKVAHFIINMITGIFALPAIGLRLLYLAVSDILKFFLWPLIKLFLKGISKFVDIVYVWKMKRNAYSFYDVIKKNAVADIMIRVLDGEKWAKKFLILWMLDEYNQPLYEFIRNWLVQNDVKISASDLTNREKVRLYSDYTKADKNMKKIMKDVIEGHIDGVRVDKDSIFIESDSSNITMKKVDIAYSMVMALLFSVILFVGVNYSGLNVNNLTLVLYGEFFYFGLSYDMLCRLWKNVRDLKMNDKGIIATRGNSIKKPVKFEVEIDDRVKSPVYLHELMHFIPGLRGGNYIQDGIVGVGVALFMPVFSLISFFYSAYSRIKRYFAGPMEELKLFLMLRAPFKKVIYKGVSYAYYIKEVWVANELLRVMFEYGERADIFELAKTRLSYFRADGILPDITEDNLDRYKMRELLLGDDIAWQGRIIEILSYINTSWSNNMLKRYIAKYRENSSKFPCGVHAANILRERNVKVVSDVNEPVFYIKKGTIAANRVRKNILAGNYLSIDKNELKNSYGIDYDDVVRRLMIDEKFLPNIGIYSGSSEYIDENDFCLAASTGVLASRNDYEVFLGSDFIRFLSDIDRDIKKKYDAYSFNLAEEVLYHEIDESLKSFDHKKSIDKASKVYPDNHKWSEFVANYFADRFGIYADESEFSKSGKGWLKYAISAFCKYKRIYRSFGLSNPFVKDYLTALLIKDISDEELRAEVKGVRDIIIGSIVENCGLGEEEAIEAGKVLFDILYKSVKYQEMFRSKSKNKLKSAIAVSDLYAMGLKGEKLAKFKAYARSYDRVLVYIMEGSNTEGLREIINGKFKGFNIEFKYLRDNISYYGYDILGHDILSEYDVINVVTDNSIEGTFFDSNVMRSAERYASNKVHVLLGNLENSLKLGSVLKTIKRLYEYAGEIVEKDGVAYVKYNGKLMPLKFSNEAVRSLGFYLFDKSLLNEISKQGFFLSDVIAEKIKDKLNEAKRLRIVQMAA